MRIGKEFLSGTLAFNSIFFIARRLLNRRFSARKALTRSASRGVPPYLAPSGSALLGRAREQGIVLH